MIIRVRILERGVILRNWALHKVGETSTLREISLSLLDGSSKNAFFPAIEPFYKQCSPVIARCGMDMADMVGTPIEFSVQDVQTGRF